MAMPNRNIEGGYRYGYQGEYAEKDPETEMEAFELRLWDGRIGRWLTTDPAGQFSSPYLGMGNNPINGTDPDGGKWFTDFINNETGEHRHVDDGSDAIVLLGNDEWGNVGKYASLYEWGLGFIADELTSSFFGEGTSYYPNEFGAYRFPESGKGFARYTTNANNESIKIDGKIYNGDNYTNANGFIKLYKTFVEFNDYTGGTVYYGDISAYDLRINLGHSTHYVGESIDIHYIGHAGEELFGKSAYKNASVVRMAIFFKIAESNGFDYNYSYGNRFKHLGNTNQSLHKDHFHIGTNFARSNSYRLRYGQRAPIKL
ncbi:MAG: RHS repeat-associated core domain-containing protein [Xanthomarina gelatinilytica]|uniref:RHS repeat-associated core domain-containing protein n=1 Tax=Xanthomarina gelatinilytica TaxID=1137281 RepID=UPI003A867F85